MGKGTLLMRASLAAAALALAGPAFAQQPPAPSQPPAMPQIVAPDKVWPASAEQVDYGALQKLPDWRGIWTPVMGPPNPADKAEEPQLLGAYKERYEAVQKLIKGGDPDALAKLETRKSACEPPGVPGIMVQPYDIEFLFTPGRVTIIQEAYMQVRRVFTDGRPLPQDPDPTYNGTSIGHWEGDTLVVTTVGLREGGSMGRWGATHSDRLTLTERIHLDPANKDVLVVENSFEDPRALAAPWHSVSRFKRYRSLDQLEFICAENDRNPINDKGEIEFLGV